MKVNNRFSIILVLLFAAFLVNAQEPQKTEISPSGTGTKAQDHNSTRSNKTASSAAPDPNLQLEGQSIQNTKPEANPSANSKKGYDYYKAKSDLAPANSGTKSQDHNSTRSNKTSSKIDQGGSQGEGVLNKGIDDKTNTNSAARGLKPKPKVP